jgi:hypothetical protein
MHHGPAEYLSRSVSSRGMVVGPLPAPPADYQRRVAHRIRAECAPDHLACAPRVMIVERTPTMQLGGSGSSCGRQLRPQSVTWIAATAEASQRRIVSGRLACAVVSRAQRFGAGGLLAGWLSRGAAIFVSSVRCRPCQLTGGQCLLDQRPADQDRSGEPTCSPSLPAVPSFHLGENGGQVMTGHLLPRNRRVRVSPWKGGLHSQAEGTPVDAGRARVAGFGRHSARTDRAERGRHDQRHSERGDRRDARRTYGGA